MLLCRWLPLSVLASSRDATGSPRQHELWRWRPRHPNDIGDGEGLETMGTPDTMAQQKRGERIATLPP
ncbi:hypothetical protein RSSM_06086 [Rhodopirellula sallentina SM41]|uniref:Uncharacterized protein n=1 Tax=Rhodopirellula sallentina SM41 TaxID=1263870 RepID=M5U911_9BACT|nr:hypothetical protein RSSM_06086 [Rhodopirellula sallentina SM41]